MSTNKVLRKLDSAKPRKTMSTKMIGLSKEAVETQKAAKKASATALRISKALNLPIQFIEKGTLVEIRGTEDRKTIKVIPKVDSKVSLKKGDKIWLKPKG